MNELKFQCYKKYLLNSITSPIYSNLSSFATLTRLLGRPQPLRDTHMPYLTLINICGDNADEAAETLARIQIHTYLPLNVIAPICLTFGNIYNHTDNEFDVHFYFLGPHQHDIQHHLQSLYFVCMSMLKILKSI
jgi:hypothetical protein